MKHTSTNNQRGSLLVLIVLGLLVILFFGIGMYSIYTTEGFQIFSYRIGGQQSNKNDSSYATEDEKTKATKKETEKTEEKRSAKEICIDVGVLQIEGPVRGGFTPYGLTCLPVDYPHHTVIASYSDKEPISFRTSYLVGKTEKGVAMLLNVLQYKTTNPNTLPFECDKLIEYIRKKPCQLAFKTSNNRDVYKYEESYYTRIGDTEISLSHSDRDVVDLSTIEALFESFEPAQPQP